MVPIIDIFLILFLAGFVFYGFFFGLIKTIGSIVSFIIGVWAASHFYDLLYQLIEGWVLGYERLGKTLAFIIIFIIVSRVVSILFSLLDSTFNFLSIIPFLKTINRFAGALLGLILGGIVLGLILYFLISFPFIGQWFMNLLSVSKILPYLIKFAGLLAPLIPEIWDRVRAVI